jgi:uncharacterized protein (TIGR03437 family)
MRWVLAIAAVQVCAQPPYTISTIAGSGNVGDGAPAASAILIQAEGVAADLNGNVYVADAGGHRVRKISPAGIISTVAGTGVNGFSGDGAAAANARLGAPYGLALDARGNLYIADLSNARVRRVSPDGTISTIAGGGAVPAGGVNEGSLATSVALQSPRNVALDAGGNLYISDFDAHRVYRLGADGFLATFAGTGIPGAGGDGGAASRAQLHFPTALAVDTQGAVYIADSGNHVTRKVTRGGIISTFARVGTPTGLAFDGFGTLYVADHIAGQITRIPVSGASTALSVLARGVAFSSDGFLYAPDGAVLRRISIAGDAAVVGGGGDPAAGDGGDALNARLNHPAGVASDAAGNVYIADRDNNRIRRVTPDGTIATLTGSADVLSAPAAVSVDGSGNVVVADTGNKRVLLFTKAGVAGGITSTLLVTPAYAVAASDGTIYIADSGAGKIFKAAPGRALAVLLDGLQSPRGLALDAAGNLYFTEADAKRVSRLSATGSVDRVADGTWNIPRGVAVAANGDVFVADTGLQRVLRVDSTGRATTIAGIGTPGFSGDGGPALQAELGFPWDVAIAPDGSVLIADLDNNRIRRLSTAAAPPAVTIGALDVLNAATLQPGPIAPGMLVALRGATGDTVLIGGTNVPILASDAQQVVVQAPMSIAGLTTVAIELRSGANTVARADVAVVDASPGLFATALNADGSTNSAANQAARGSIVTLFGTGEGIGLPVTVSIANIAAQVLYAGPAPGYPGLLQLNVRVPTGFFNAGDVPLTFSAGTATSQPGVTISVGN